MRKAYWERRKKKEKGDSTTRDTASPPQTNSWVGTPDYKKRFFQLLRGRGREGGREKVFLGDRSLHKDVEKGDRLDFFTLLDKTKKSHQK